MCTFLSRSAFLGKSKHQLLEKDNPVTIHQRNLQTLTIEIFKIHSNIAPEIMKDVFRIKYIKYHQ